MSDSVLVLWDEAFLDYDHGEHPMHPVRLELTVALARQLGVLDRPAVRLVAPQSASDALLELVHDPSYVNAVRRPPDDIMGRLGLRYGLGTDDNPVFERMHESSALVTGGTLDAARAVHEGTAQHAVNLAGGLHHVIRGTGRRGFVSTTTPRWRSPGCWTRGFPALPTSTSTSTTVRPALTADQARQLRERAAAGERKSTLAREFGISRETVYSYLAGSSRPSDGRSGARATAAVRNIGTKTGEQQSTSPGGAGPA